MTPREQALAATWTRCVQLADAGDWIGAATVLQHDGPAPDLDALADRLHRRYRRHKARGAVLRWLIRAVRRPVSRCGNPPRPARRHPARRHRSVYRQVRTARRIYRALS